MSINLRGSKGSPRIMAVLSDMGDILFSTAGQADQRKEAFEKIFLQKGSVLSPDEIMLMYRPFKTLGQTVMSEGEGIELFFRDNGINAKYEDFKALCPSRERGFPNLVSGVAESLLELRRREIPFVVVSDTSMREHEIWESLERMLLAQINEGHEYNTSGFDSHEIDVKDYVTGIASSRDVGVKKPDKKIFRYALDLAGGGLEFGDALFIAHEAKEIFGAAGLGMHVAAFNYGIEKDACMIKERIEEHNERFKMGQAKSCIYPIERFSDILNLGGVRR